jgi:hypothetical protein
MALGFDFHPSGWGFALAYACSADHFPFRRVVSVNGFDTGSHPLDLVPYACQLRIALVAQVRQLRLKDTDLGLRVGNPLDIRRQALEGQLAKGQATADLAPVRQNALGLLKYILWIDVHDVVPPKQECVFPGTPRNFPQYAKKQSNRQFTKMLSFGKNPGGFVLPYKTVLPFWSHFAEKFVNTASG